MRALSRIFLSFCSMLLAVAIFSLLLGRMGGWLFIMKVALIFAFPVWLIDLSFLFLFRNAGRHGTWIVPAIGALIGPVCLALWCCVLVLTGSSWTGLWQGDPEAGGLEWMLIFSSLIGLATNSFYAVALALRRRFTAQ